MSKFGRSFNEKMQSMRIFGHWVKRHTISMFMYILGMFITIERVFEYETDVEYAPVLSIILERVYVFDTVIMHANLMALRIMDLNLCQISYRIRPMATETEIKGPKMQYEKSPSTQIQTQQHKSKRIHCSTASN